MATKKNRTASPKTSAKKKASAGKTSASNKKTTARRQSTARVKQPDTETADLTRDVILWCVLAVSAVLFLSNLGIGGVVGNAVSGVFFGVFGLIAYFFPIGLLVGTFFGISNRNNRIALLKLAAAVIFVLFLCVLIELMAHGADTLGGVQAFYYGREHKAGGGFAGGVFAAWLCRGFGLIGAYVITIALLIIAFVLITEKSAVRRMQQQKEQARETAMLRRKERQERQEKILQDRQRQVEALKQDAKKPRRKRKIEGVAFNTRLTEEVPVKEHASDEVNEVKISIFDEEVEVTDCSRIPLTADGGVSKSSVSLDAGSAEPESEATQPVILEQKQPKKTPEQPKEVRKTKQGQQTPENPSIGKPKDEVHISHEPEDVPVQEYRSPPVSLLRKPDRKGNSNTKNTLKETADKLQQTLKNFGVNVTVTDVSCGPSVTRYELQPEMGVKVSKIVNLSDDIKLNLAAADIRIEAPIPGKAAVGIEVPNKEKIMVTFRELIESQEFVDSSSNISFAVGRDIGGQIIVANIAKMPHLLIAGATGSGKSVCINTIIMSILYKANPADVKFIMIDPKVVELSIYNGIPHLLIPVVTDPKKAAGALHWAVTEMMERYQKFADVGVKDMKAYNDKIKDGVMQIRSNGETVEMAVSRMPQIVIVVDELADLMMVAAGDVEEAICRLAQLARAAGIHLIIATQRPSVNVITGLIKANMPSRIAFSVTSSVDSRTILDMGGAEKLLGNGDMLYYPQGRNQPLRVQGAFVSEDEVQKVVQFLTQNNVTASYDEQIQEKITSAEAGNKTTAIGTDDGFSDARDAYFEAAGRLIIEKEKGSIGMLQRNFKIGFNRAARIMDQLEEAGVVGPEEGTKPRRVLLTAEAFDQILSEPS